MGQNWTVKESKMKFWNFITNYVDFTYWRFSMIFTFAAIYNKLLKLKLPEKFIRICNYVFAITNHGQELDS